MESDALVPTQEETTSYSKPETRKSGDSIDQPDTMGLEAYDRQNEALTRRLLEREMELKKLEEEQEDRIAYISQQAQQLEKEITARKKEILDYKSREQQASLQIQEVGQTVHLVVDVSRDSLFALVL
jgi:predicted RNase H-like nuclease (RuvC/YqgF family)